MALVGISNEEKIWNYLKDKGLNDFGCAGLMGNLQAESGLRPNNLQNTYEKKLGYTDDEYVAAVDSGQYTNFVKDKAGFGLAQWTYWSRKQKLIEHAQASKQSIGDLEMQLDFLWSELTKSYKAVVSTLKKATSVREASDAVLLKYEKPANQGTSVQERRESYGQAFYNKYAGVETTETNNKKEDLTVTDGVITAYAVKNDCYKAATPMTPRGIVVHSTGANNPNLKRYVDCVSECGENQYGNHWNNPSSKMGRKVCVHSFIGYDKNNKVRVANILPYNYACWGVGGGSNGSFNYDPQGHIQFEMCEDSLTDKAYCTEVYNTAVEYSAWLCKKFGLDPMGKNVIVSHKEAHALGYGSNHGDPDNWWKKHGYTMDKFRAAVKAKVGGATVAVTQPITSALASAYKPRVAAPATSDRYWIHTSKGGLNSCILIGGNSCLPNCVGYAWGRWYELLGSEPKLSRANAENWYTFTADGYKRSSTPELGAVICWRKGQAGNGKDGAGHVAIVEDIKSNGDIVTSNSAYSGTRFYMQTLTKSNGYRIGNGYTFQGFILLPKKVSATNQPSLSEPYLVKVTASALNIRKGPGTTYGTAGTIKDKGIYTIIDEASGAGATKWGLLKSKVGWISLDYCKKM